MIGSIAREEDKQRPAAVNTQLRLEASKAQVIDKGFYRFARHFKENEPVHHCRESRPVVGARPKRPPPLRAQGLLNDLSYLTYFFESVQKSSVKQP
jgi:hypothetical protein